MDITLGGHVYEDVTVEKYAYKDGSPALVVMQRGEQVAVATVFLVHEQPADGCVWVKDWSENAGMLAWLVDAGVIEVTGRVAQAGFVHAHEARLVG